MCGRTVSAVASFMPSDKKAALTDRGLASSSRRRSLILPKRSMISRISSEVSVLAAECLNIGRFRRIFEATEDARPGRCCGGGKMLFAGFFRLPIFIGREGDRASVRFCEHGRQSPWRYQGCFQDRTGAPVRWRRFPPVCRRPALSRQRQYMHGRQWRASRERCGQ